MSGEMIVPVVRNVEDQLAAEAAKAAGTYVYIGRDSRHGVTRWGNPYRIPRDGDRRAVIARYETYMRLRVNKNENLYSSFPLVHEIRALGGKELFCHCSPLLCHGSVLVKLWHELTGVVP